MKRYFQIGTKTQKATVKALLEEIELRENLDTHLLKKIEEEISIHNSQLLNLNNLRFYNNIDLFKDMSKVKVELENNILELKKKDKNILNAGVT